MSTATIEVPETVNHDEADKVAHIINPPKNTHIWRPYMTSKDIVTIARKLGLPVEALCGAIFIPSQDPDNLPACQPCFDVAQQLMAAAGE